MLKWESRRRQRILIKVNVGRHPWQIGQRKPEGIVNQSSAQKRRTLRPHSRAQWLYPCSSAPSLLLSPFLSLFRFFFTLSLTRSHQAARLPCRFHVPSYMLVEMKPKGEVSRPLDRSIQKVFDEFSLAFESPPEWIHENKRPHGFLVSGISDDKFEWEKCTKFYEI